MKSKKVENRYPIKLSKYSSHSKIARFLNSETKLNESISILDIGCSKGELRDLIKANSVRYVGVEPFREDFQSAQTKGLEVINCSAEDAMTQIKERFEFIVFADVLEHLQDPAAVLESCHGLLKPKGKIIISIPNIAHFSTRATLLFGQWNYTDRGILDRTHLRFFTKKSFRAEIVDCGFSTVKFMSTPIPLEALFPRLNRYLFHFLDNLMYLPILLNPKIFGYQHLWIITSNREQSSV
jgi:2-polyprenyl-3-methyl-5-hydroxy-6-metoxy-1,4-benzoquinol methylase